MSENTEVLAVDALAVWTVSLDCPHCSATQGGWVSDPRGREYKCYECHKTYRVPADVRIVF